MLNSRERIQLALDHQEADRVPLDLGGTFVSGMHVSSVYKLRQMLALDPPDTPVKVVEPFQMLGEIQPDLADLLGVDVTPLGSAMTVFNFKNENWKPWRTFDQTPVLVPGGFNTDPEPDGFLFIYPEGDKTAPPAGRMPQGGWYFDSLPLQTPVDERMLRVEDNLEEFQYISDAELDYLHKESERLYTQTNKAILGDFGGTAFGDVSLIPGPGLRHPKGIRGVEEWYISTLTRRKYIFEVFERQCEIALANLERVYQAVGNRVTAVFVSGTDFGTQQGPIISIKTYRELYKPFHKRVNDWIHRNTTWKTFLHSCGSVMPLIDDFIEDGFDILNPVQWSAAHMEPAELKRRFGDQITFWGGGINTQHTLPSGTPQQVWEEVEKSIQTFAPGGGFVFSAIHNIQPNIPVENILALFNAVKAYR